MNGNLAGANTEARVRSAPPSLIHALTSVVAPLDLRGLFPVPGPVEVELGSGDASFLVQYAGLNPDRNFLGVERMLGRLRKLDRKGNRAGLTNLRGLRIEAAYLLEYLVPPGSVSAFHVYFPDPWPKRRHWPRRLVNDRFTETTSRALLAGGTVYLRTDSSDYFRQMESVFAASTAFCAVETPTRLSEVLTDFERDFLAQGVQTHRAAFRKLGP